MASPGKSATPEDGTSTASLKLSLGDLMKEPGSAANTAKSSKGKANEVGGSLPTTPSKLKDIDPAIISATEHGRGSHGQTGPGITHHKRTASSSSVVTVKAWKGQEPVFSLSRAEALMARPGTPDWSRGSDKFVFGPDSAAIFDSPTSPGDMSNDESVFRSPTPKPRQDRDGARISAENAQGYFKASLCIFVANLDAKSADQDLEAAVYKSFSRFGELWVKIRRDRNTMPYAFCQYTKEADAAAALARGHGLMILGRACRVELAKANRSVYVSRTTGGKITETEAREIFAEEGPLEKVWYPTDTDKEVYRLAEGIWVTFAFFQDARDAQNNFKDSKEFRLEVPFSPEERERLRGSSYPLRAGSMAPSPPTSAAKARRERVLQTFRRNRLDTSVHHEAAIFVANLPENITVETLRECFETCGILRTIEVVAKVSDSGMSTFAFVQFSNGNGVWNAITRDMRINGRLLRIEERDSFGGSAQRRTAMMGSPRRGPLTPYTPRSDHGHMKAPDPAPRSMASITEGTSQAQIQNQPQTPVNHPFYNHGVPFGSPFTPFGGYYPQNQTEAGPGSISPFANQQGMISAYPIPGYAPSPWSPTGYNYPLLYSGPTPGDVAAPNASSSADAPIAGGFNENNAAPSGASH